MKKFPAFVFSQVKSAFQKFLSWFFCKPLRIRIAIISASLLAAGMLSLVASMNKPPENSPPSQLIVLQPNEENPALLSSIDISEEQTGAGTAENDNSIDVYDPGAALLVAPLAGTRFITLSSMDEYFVVNGIITRVAGYANVREAPLDFSESDQYLVKVRFTKPGFYGLTIREAAETSSAGQLRYYSVFVSPVPTMHTDAASGDFDWYMTQFNTGTTSNCGPASASMGVGWSTGKQLPVSEVRKAVGWQGEGGTSFEELTGVLKSHGVPALVSPLRNIQHIKDVIDSGGIAIVLFVTDGVKTAKGNPANDLFGKYYEDSVGHYIVVKGYSLNDEYLVIYDPIPSDWSSNSFRYGDDVSMIGRNRYYAAKELLGSLRRAEMIVVPKITK